MDTDIMTQNPTLKQVGGRAVGAEGGGEVREVRKGAFEEARAGVSGWDAGAVCTLELVGEAGGGGGGGREDEEEQGGVGEGREHPEDRSRGFPRASSYLYPGLFRCLESQLEKLHNCLTQE